LLREIQGLPRSEVTRGVGRAQVYNSPEPGGAGGQEEILEACVRKQRGARVAGVRGRNWDVMGAGCRP
jgi:hypothetical protein